MIKKPKKFKYPSQTEKRTFMQIFKELVFSLKETFLGSTKQTNFDHLLHIDKRIRV